MDQELISTRIKKTIKQIGITDKNSMHSQYIIKRSKRVQRICKKNNVPYQLIKSIITSTVLCFILLSNIHAQEFTIGASIGHTFESETQNGNADFGAVFRYGELFFPVGALTNISNPSKGWGWRSGAGIEFENDFGLCLTVNYVNLDYPHSVLSYGFSGTWKIFKDVRLEIGTETIRGFRIGLQYK